MATPEAMAISEKLCCYHSISGTCDSCNRIAAALDSFRAEGVPPLGRDSTCLGCGNEKKHRGKTAGSLICCAACVRHIPKWMRDMLVEDHRRPPGGSPHGVTIWERRIAVLLTWLRDAAAIRDGR